MTEYDIDEIIAKRVIERLYSVEIEEKWKLKDRQ
jgi:hypothetical protein